MNINNNTASPNHDPRTHPIEYIIIHYTEMTFASALQKLIDPKAKVSAHYLIKNDGEILQLVQDKNIAWHAGQSMWRQHISLNQHSIGIELDNLGNCAFSTDQLASCINLCNNLTKKHNIKLSNIIGHSDIAPARKIDPGIFFDWQLLASHGLGIWYDEDILNSTENYHDNKNWNFGDKDPQIQIIQEKLKSLGYNIQITSIFDIQTNYVIRAFQSKFCPSVIHEQGIDFYKNDHSQYKWNLLSNNILNNLISI